MSLYLIKHSCTFITRYIIIIIIIIIIINVIIIIMIIEVRMVGLDSPYQGTVQILQNGKWATVKRYNSKVETNAIVACRQLGLPAFTQLLDPSLPINIGSHYWSDNFQCNGTEDSLSSCSLFVSGSSSPLNCRCDKGERVVI